MHRLRMVTAIVLGWSLAAGGSADAYPRPGRTERISTGWDGMQTLLSPTAPTISGDGRFVTFETDLPMVAGDTNAAMDVFVKDRETGVLRAASTGPNGEHGNGLSSTGIISGNGRYVVFATTAPELLQEGQAEGLVLKDLSTGSLEPVSVSSTEIPADLGSIPTAITHDGRFVAFESSATNLVADDTNGSVDVFLRDRSSGTTERVSVGDDEAQLRGHSDGADISDDGRFIVFTSERTSPPLDAVSDARDMHQIFIRDRAQGTTVLVSQAPDGTVGNGWSSSPTVSNDGRYVAFASGASNLVPNDSNRATDVFIRDLQTGITERLSVAFETGEANNGSVNPIISGDGRFVSFTSDASNLVPDDSVQCIAPIPPKVPESGDRFSCLDVFLHDRVTGTTELVSLGDDGSQASNYSHYSPLSEDGRYVAFSSGGTNLVPGDTDREEDVYLRDRGPTIGVGAADARDAGGGVRVSGWATFSGSEISALADDPADAPAARALGGELTAARVAYRHEERSLFVRLYVADLAAVRVPNAPGEAVACVLATGCPPGVAETPLSHGLAFDHEGITWRVLATRSGTELSTAGGVAFSLYRCESAGCIHAARLKGSWFVAGNQVSMVLPLVQIDAQPGDPITNLRAYAGVGEAILGTQEVDSLVLPDAALPVARVEVGVAGHDGPRGVTSIAPFGGRFDHALPASELGPDRRVWARGCLDQVCTGWTRAL